VFPSKVLTLLAAGKPVVASVSAGSEVARVIAESGAGLVIAPEDADALVSAVERIRRDHALRDSMSQAGRAYARRTWERAATLESLNRTLEAAAHAAGAA
jgi:colanic acid biosynthesis glycosyl transferase WcaI